MRISARHLPLLSALCLAACSGGDSAPATKMATENQVTDPVLGNRIKSGDPLSGDHDGRRIAEKYGSWNTAMTADGQSTGKGGKEFAGFNRDNKEFKGKWDNKEFKAGDYRKKSWWGDKDYTAKVYDGNTDGSRFQKESRFGEKSANEGAMAAREGSESYGTKDFNTGRAREEGGDRISKVSDAEIDERRRVFTTPDVIPWQQQNLTVEDTKRMLGKDR